MYFIFFWWLVEQLLYLLPSSLLSVLLTLAPLRAAITEIFTNTPAAAEANFIYASIYDIFSSRFNLSCIIKYT